MNILTINGYVLTPSELSYTRSALDDGDSTFRGIDGTLQRSVIRKDIEKLEVTFYSADLSTQVVKDLLHAIDDTWLTVTFFSPYEGGLITKTMYTGDRVLSAYRFDKNTNRMIWEDISFSLIVR
jgi:hypothetical protein